MTTPAHHLAVWLPAVDMMTSSACLMPKVERCHVLGSALALSGFSQSWRQIPSVQRYARLRRRCMLSQHRRNWSMKDFGSAESSGMQTLRYSLQLPAAMTGSMEMCFSHSTVICLCLRFFLYNQCIISKFTAKHKCLQINACE